jgi:hypothetical protein
MFPWSKADGTGIVDDLALILYVYLPNDDDGSEDSVLTVSQQYYLDGNQD